MTRAACYISARIAHYQSWQTRCTVHRGRGLIEFIIRPVWKQPNEVGTRADRRRSAPMTDRPTDRPAIDLESAVCVRVRKQIITDGRIRGRGGGGLRELLFKGRGTIVGPIDPSPNNTPEGNAKYKQWALMGDARRDVGTNLPIYQFSALFFLSFFPYFFPYFFFFFEKKGRDGRNGASRHRIFIEEHCAQIEFRETHSTLWQVTAWIEFALKDWSKFKRKPMAYFLGERKRKSIRIRAKRIARNRTRLAFVCHC